MYQSIKNKNYIVRARLALMWAVFCLFVSSAMAWRPSGWTWMAWPYAYAVSTGHWYYFRESDVQSIYGYGPRVGWTSMRESGLASGWSWHTWPYAFDVEASTWSYINEVDVQWTYKTGGNVVRFMGLRLYVLDGGTNNYLNIEDGTLSSSSFRNDDAELEIMPFGLDTGVPGRIHTTDDRNRMAVITGDPRQMTLADVQQADYDALFLTPYTGLVFSVRAMSSGYYRGGPDYIGYGVFEVEQIFNDSIVMNCTYWDVYPAWSRFGQAPVSLPEY